MSKQHSPGPKPARRHPTRGNLAPHRSRRRVHARVDALEPRTLLSGISFNANQVIGTGYLPSSAAVADFDGDGSPDVVVANSVRGEGIGLSLNNGKGALGKQVRVAAIDAYAVASGDFNADGRPDLAVGNIDGPGVLNVLLNLGGGAFGAPLPYAVPGQPKAITSADFNGDGRTDVAVAGLGGSGLGVLRNNGNGTFAPVLNYDAPGGNSVVAADFNADGRPDLAVPNAWANTVGVLRNNGDGTFAARVDYAVGANPFGVTAADYGGDGRPDLAVTSTGGDSVSVLRNNGNGTFAPKVDYAIGFSAEVRSVVSADFNGDGRADLATANKLGTPVTVFTNNGDGRFTRYGSFDDVMGVDRLFAVSGDFDRDGRADLAVLSQQGFSSSSSGLLSVLRNRGTARLFAGDWYSVGYVESIVSTDVNRDGRADLASVVGNNQVAVQINSGSGAFAARVTYPAAASNLQAYSVTSADFDGDGWTDFAVGGYAPTLGAGTVNVLRNNGNGTFAPPVAYPVPGGYWVTSADWNGDGRPDVAVTNSGRSNTVSVLMNKGDGTFAAAVSYPTGRSPAQVTAGDFDGDGRADLAISNYADNTVSVLRNRGDGTFDAKVDHATAGGPREITSADLNGDGRPELAVASQTGNAVGVLRNNGDGTFAARVDYAVGKNTNRVVADDFDGDGWSDLAVVNPIDRTLGVLANRGDGTFADPIGYATGIGSGAVAVTSADLNGDGSPDLAAGDATGLVLTLMNKAAFGPRVLPATFAASPTSVTVTFSESVGTSLAAGDLVITPLAGGASFSPASVTVDPGTNTTRFRFTTPLPDGNYRARIAANAVADSAGNSMAADFSADFFVLAGDANRDRTVNFTDLLALAKNYNGTGKSWAQGDFNGDGIVNFTDLLMLAKGYNKTLAAPAPVATASASVLPSFAAPLSPVLAPEDGTAKPVFSTTPVKRPVPPPTKVKPAARPVKR